MPHRAEARGYSCSGVAGRKSCTDLGVLIRLEVLHGPCCVDTAGSLAGTLSLLKVTSGVQNGKGGSLSLFSL